MPPKVCVNKLKKEMKSFLGSPPPHIPAISVNERNMLEWHFLIEGPPDTPYKGGWYIGKLRFPPEYPWKPPSIMMLTPSGRFATGTRLCLSMSDFHPESWNPMWTVSSILTGLLSFMLEDQITTGSLQTTAEEKQELAAQSVSYNLEHAQLKAMFEKELQAAKQHNSQAPHSLSSMSGLEGAVSNINAAEGDSRAAASTSDSVLVRSAAAQPADALNQQQAASTSGPAHEGSSPAPLPAAGFDSERADAVDAARLEAAASLDPARVHGLGDEAHQARCQAQIDLLAELLMDANPGEALVQVEAALREHGDEDPFRAELLLRKGQILARLGELQAAMHALDASLAGQQPHQSAIKISGLRFTYKMALRCKDEGNALFRAGQLDEAVGRYTSAIAIEPHYAVAQCNLAAALAKLGEHQQAIFAAQAALRTNKNYEKAKLRIRLSHAVLADSSS